MATMPKAAGPSQPGQDDHHGEVDPMPARALEEEQRPLRTAVVNRDGDGKSGDLSGSGVECSTPRMPASHRWRTSGPYCRSSGCLLEGLRRVRYLADGGRRFNARSVPGGRARSRRQGWTSPDEMLATPGLRPLTSSHRAAAPPVEARRLSTSRRPEPDPLRVLAWPSTRVLPNGQENDPYPRLLYTGLARTEASRSRTSAWHACSRSAGTSGTCIGPMGSSLATDRRWSC